jgi:hypothetical protein
MNPWRIVSMLLLPISIPVAFLYQLFVWLSDESGLWDALEDRRRLEGIYARPGMRNAWKCGRGYLNRVGPVMLPNGDRVPSTMCGNCGGDRPNEKETSNG